MKQLSKEETCSNLHVAMLLSWKDAERRGREGVAGKREESRVTSFR